VQSADNGRRGFRPYRCLDRLQHFVALVAVGFASGELRFRGLLIAVLVCAIGKLVLGYVSYDAMFPSVVAVVDVALILIVVKGDVKL